MEVVADTLESKNSLASDEEENKRALKVFFQQQFGELLLMVCIHCSFVAFLN